MNYNSHNNVLLPPTTDRLAAALGAPIHIKSVNQSCAGIKTRSASGFLCDILNVQAPVLVGGIFKCRWKAVVAQARPLADVEPVELYTLGFEGPLQKIWMPRIVGHRVVVRVPF